MIQLRKAGIKNAEELHEMCVRSFRPLLDKYRDFETSPAAETLDQMKARLQREGSDYYFIQLGPQRIGGIRVQLSGQSARISPVFLLPEHQGKGYAQQALAAVEKLYPSVTCWSLDTIKQEEKLCHFYEKLGYRRTGREEKLKENMDLVFYEKKILLKG